MSMFEDTRYRWRETYFVLFRSSRRPELERVTKALCALDNHYQLANLGADDKGRFDSLTLRSPDDYSALDICYISGPEVLEQGAALVDDMKVTPDESQRGMLEQIRQADARFDVLHFEQVSDLAEADDQDEMLDPGALLLVLGALAGLTGGIALDPQGGNILSEEE